LRECQKVRMTAQVSELRPVARVPPHDLDAEAAVLSAIVIDPSTLPSVRAMLHAGDFYADANRRIFEAIQALHGEGTAIDITLVAARLRASGRLDQVGGTPYLMQVLEATPATAHVLDHAKVVRDKARLRAAIAHAQLVAATGHNPEAAEDPGAFLREASDGFERIAAGSLSDSLASGAGPTLEDPFRGIARLAGAALLGRDRIVDLAARPIEYLWADIALAGIIVVIAGGPGSGKTTLLFLILAARLNRGAPLTLLGREVTPAPSDRYLVLVEAEHGDASTARKLLRSCSLLGVDYEALDRIIVIARRSVRIGSPEWAEIGRLVAAGLVSDLALDTLARVAPADANSEQEQVSIFAEIARTLDMAPSGQPKPVAWVVAHTKKDTADELSDVSGSTQRVGQADTVLLVKAERRDGRVVSSRVVFAKLREEPDDYPAPQEYSLAKEQLVEQSAPAVGDERPLEERILERLALGPQTKNGLRSALGRSDAHIEGAITNLFSAKAIRTTSVKVRGSDRRAFELNSQASSGNGNPP
jgi:hypothetical protein